LAKKEKDFTKPDSVVRNIDYGDKPRYGCKVNSRLLTLLQNYCYRRNHGVSMQIQVQQIAKAVITPLAK